MSLSPTQVPALKTLGAYVGAGAAAAIATSVIEGKVEQPGENGIVDKLSLGAVIGSAGLTFLGPAVGFNQLNSPWKSAVVGGLLGTYIGAQLIHKD